MNEEAILTLPTARDLVPHASMVRSTWLTSSVRSLRERKLLDAYLAALPSEYHEAVLQSAVGVWLPFEVCMQHYRACETLPLTAAERVEIGFEAVKRAQGSTFGVAVRLASASSVTPFTVLPQLQRFWDRAFIGGAIAAAKLGPKEVRIEIAGWPCASIPYCRTATRGVILGVFELFCKKAYVNEVPRLCTGTSLGHRVSWV